MSTNAIIKVEGVGYCALYKHWDGYPEATLAWLEKFNKEFTEERGDDGSYKMAQLIRSSAFMQAEFDLDPSTTTGWGVVMGVGEGHRKDYTYTLKKDGTVEFRHDAAIRNVDAQIEAITIHLEEVAA
ncbi:hypothetical protein UFOVP275_55 [uncultured Caudovirales phage]|uniref:Uncharacterized protein n=1 Tax=uncultured Caudovirales phage TaxID=2100421 RepID=A0A6J5LLB5_9CAUD|nr:hypothetical protein UFOVP275_55 [uncultured Caudovirales phage]